jgi:hypothetical protein
MSISEFLSTIKESQFNIAQIYEKAPNETMILLAIIVVAIVVVYFVISNSIKVSNTVKLVENILDSKTYDEIDKKLSILSDELPKRGVKVTDALNLVKEHLLFRTSKLLANMTISQKIEKYQELSKKYSQIAQASKKQKNEDLVVFYEEKSKELLEVNLAEEIAYYLENVHFNENEVENVNAIVKYANSSTNPESIIDPMIQTMNKFSYGYNIDLFKLIEKLTKEDSKQVFENANEKMEELFISGDKEISKIILDYLLEKNENQKVYDYISSLSIKSYLQQLHDLNLDLAFIANPLKIDSNYKSYLDESLTTNWRDSSHIEFLSKSKGVLEVLGHMEFRTLIERIDNIKVENENRKMIEEALAIAKRAESIALEAKSLNKRPVIMTQATQVKKTSEN